MRILFSRLPESSKQDLLIILQTLFKVENIKFIEKGSKLIIVEKGVGEFEVSMLGLAMQRIIATEILFHTLLLIPIDTQRIFFLKEPEFFLSSSLVSIYIESLYTRAVCENIQLIVTSNSPIVINRFNQTNRKVLSFGQFLSL